MLWGGFFKKFPFISDIYLIIPHTKTCKAFVTKFTYRDYTGFGSHLRYSGVRVRDCMVFKKDSYTQLFFGGLSKREDQYTSLPKLKLSQAHWCPNHTCLK